MKCPHCPYYEVKTSYGIELVKCNNEECEEGEKMGNTTTLAESEVENGE